VARDRLGLIEKKKENWVGVIQEQASTQSPCKSLSKEKERDFQGGGRGNGGNDLPFVHERRASRKLSQRKGE